MDGKVMTFRGDYYFLSNMFSVTFEWDGRIYKSSEAAFQSAKSLDPAVRDEFSAMSGMVAKREGKKVKLRGDWESVKEEIMEEVVRAKFSQNPELLEKLINTGDMELKEGNRWGDTYWGVNAVTGKGENRLGVILMKVRAELGGAAYFDKVGRMRAEKEEARRTKEQIISDRIAAVQDELNALPAYDFTGMQMATKAFGRVTILSHEGDRLRFMARGTEKAFALPDCIVQGFLIPDNDETTDSFRRRKALLDEMKQLEKELKANKN